MNIAIALLTIPLPQPKITLMNYRPVSQVVTKTMSMPLRTEIS